MENNSSRRQLLKQLAVGSVAMAANPLASLAAADNSNMKLKGNINHSVCRWTYNFLPLDELCKVGNKIGLKAIDLVGPKEWNILKSHGLDSSMCNGAEISLTKGWNHTEYHSTLIKNYTDHINYVADAGYKNLICFSGSRDGMDDETGLKNCVEGLKQIMGFAEKRGVMIQMELLNSKIDHKDYMCDRSVWGVELCKRLGSENFKLLYDIYHMQIDEGDVIRTIKNNHQYYGHYHTAGVPGRHEIDDTQELFYPAIIKAISDSGFKGYLAQEFIPTGKEKEDKIKALKKAVKICDV
ncbi:hydroxypyruvate isomerase family protein [Ferruginibacter sp.]|nr:TIM barrel protein [Ferruginibacter sp.]